jgi:ABC-type dipeptide/oligopeptide/nickel transport system permease component
LRKHILRQLATAVPTLLGVSIAVFLMLHLTPGGAVEALILQEGTAFSGESIEEMKQALGFNDPLYIQYGRFLGRVLRGDFGESYRTQEPVVNMIRAALPSTIRLAFGGMAVAIVLGLSMGVISAVWHNTWIDNACMVVAMIGWSTPSFWLGFMFILIFTVRLDWLPLSGEGSAKLLIMPALTLGLGAAGVIARLVRAGMLDTMNMDYVRTARAKGLSEGVVISKHVLRNTLIPVVTIVGLQLGRLLGGTVIIETVFAREGIGRLAVRALQARDMPTIQAIVLLMAVIYVLINLLVDLSYGALDPRISNE